MKIGFEIHQQLETRKLFCACPSLLREEDADFKIERRLRPTQSELGETDMAAMLEFMKGRSFVYEGYRNTTCLVEADEEPPHSPNDEAVEIALQMAALLHARIVDEIQFMRKLVIDGSNTSGFQRTTIVAMDGYVETEGGRIGIPTICLEEEAARKIREDDRAVTYRLDRLVITNQRMVWVNWSSFFRKEEHELEFRDIQDIHTREKGILSYFRIFDYGLFQVETAASSVTINFEDAPDPEGIKQFIFDYCLKKK